MLSLVLRPRAVLRNSTAFSVSLEAGGTVCVASPPGTDTLCDWQPLQQRPRTAHLLLRTSTPEGLRLALRSGPFALEPGEPSLLHCSFEAPGQHQAQLQASLCVRFMPSCFLLLLYVTQGFQPSFF